jgi:outer membrane murein-binding lipoprotein Lpp
MLSRIHIPPRTHEWLTHEARADRERDAERRQGSINTLRTAITDHKSELNELLSLRLRKLLTDAAYLAKQAEIETQIRGLESQLARVERDVFWIDGDVRAVFDFATRAAEVMLAGTEVQRRMVLEAAGLNYSLEAGSIKLAWAEPLSLVEKAATRLDWSGLVDDVRTLITDKGLNVGRFERALRAMDGMMPDIAKAA